MVNRLGISHARSRGNRTVETAVTGRLGVAVAIWQWNCLTLTTDVTDGSVGSWRASTRACAACGRGSNRSVAVDGNRSRASSGPPDSSRTSGDRSRGLGELSTVALAGETIAEVLRVAAGDGVGVCGQLVQLLCEREREGIEFTYCSRLQCPGW